MTNIFRDLDNLSTNDLRVELALINNINFTNMARQVGNRVVGALADFTYSFVKTVSANVSAPSYEVTQMSDVIKKNYDELAGISRDVLKSNIKKTLMERCRASLGTTDKLSEERASYMIVTEASKMYASPKYSSFAAKIHDIGIYYNKDLILAVHEMIQAQSPQEAADFDSRIQKRLDIISLESKRELSKRLFPKEFSGRGIANVFRLEKGTRYLETAISIMGIECFDYMSAYAACAARSLRKLNSMRRSVYAQLVWKIYGITDDYREKLPSYVNTVKAPDVIAQENEFRQMLKNRIEADKELERLHTQLTKSESDKDRLSEKLTALQTAAGEAKNEFDSLEEQKDTYMSGVRPQAETKRYYSQVNSAKRRMDTTQSETDAAQKKYDDMTARIDGLTAEIAEKETASRKLKSQTNAKLIDITENIKRRWNGFYTRIIFGDDVYGQAVLAFSRDELYCVEQILLEFMELEDVTALDGEPGVIFVNVSETSVARIKHEGLTVTAMSRS